MFCLLLGSIIFEAAQRPSWAAGGSEDANIHVCFSPELRDVCESLQGCRSLREVQLTGNPLQQESSWRYAASASLCDLLSGRDAGLVSVCSGCWRLSQRRKISIHAVEPPRMTLVVLVFFSLLLCWKPNEKPSYLYHFTSALSKLQPKPFFCAPHLLLDYRDKPQTVFFVLSS